MSPGPSTVQFLFWPGVQTPPRGSQDIPLRAAPVIVARPEYVPPDAPAGAEVVARLQAEIDRVEAQAVQAAWRYVFSAVPDWRKHRVSNRPPTAQQTAEFHRRLPIEQQKRANERAYWVRKLARACAYHGIEVPRP